MVEGKARRTLSNVDRFWEPDEIHKLIYDAQTYGLQQSPQTFHRQRALLALLYLTGGRISEVLSLRRNQFTRDKNFILIKDMAVYKRKKKVWKAVPIRPIVYLPLKGKLAGFTEMALEYLNGPYWQAGDDKLFNFGRRQALNIVKFSTGKWCHWFRAMMESYFARIMDRDLAEYLKVQPRSVEPYLIPDIKRYRKDLLK